MTAQRAAHQPRRTDRSRSSSRHDSTKNLHDLARCGAASGCMRWLGGTTPEARADLPDVMAREGVPGDGVRMRSFAARLDAMAVACLPWDGVRGPFLRFRSPPGRPPDACLWDAARKRSRRWPVQAGHAFLVTARGCPIRTCWRSGRSNHGVESGVGFSAQRLLVPAQRAAHQPRRPDRSGSFSRHDTTENRPDLACRNGVGLHALVGRHHAGGSR
jgi:hypothetical protein